MNRECVVKRLVYVHTGEVHCTPVDYAEVRIGMNVLCVPEFVGALLLDAIRIWTIECSRVAAEVRLDPRESPHGVAVIPEDTCAL